MGQLLFPISNNVYFCTHKTDLYFYKYIYKNCKYA